MSLIIPTQKQNIAILGDSITAIGHYIGCMKDYFDFRYPGHGIVLSGYGKSGETLSGLCETGRLVPRGCFFDRADEVLPLIQHSDLILFCYGMNDGIYEPYSETHMQAYKNGVIRLCEILGQCPRIALTPPPFDAKSYLYHRSLQPPLPPGSPVYPEPFMGYDDVLEKYSIWLMTQKGKLLHDVVDIHAPINAYIHRKRKENPGYVYGDGIHPGLDGHCLIAKLILEVLTGEQISDFTMQASPEKSEESKN